MTKIHRQWILDELIGSDDDLEAIHDRQKLYKSLGKNQLRQDQRRKLQEAHG